MSEHTCPLCKMQVEEIVCKSCSDHEALAAYESGLAERDAGAAIVRFLKAETGHKLPLTAAEIVARPNLKILEECLHAL